MKMPIREETIDTLFKAIHKIGEPEVLAVLNKIQERDSLIDKITDLVCLRMDINKSFLFIKNNRSDSRNNALMAIIYILKQYEIPTTTIQSYFSYPGMRVNEIKDSFFQLSDNIAYQKDLKNLIFALAEEADPIFISYFFIKKNNHGR